MIELHAWPTPNGIKISIMLEECGLPFTSVPIDIRNGDQFKPDFLKISPNNKVPAIVDPDGPDGKPISLFESGAILIYLAEKTGKFMPKDPAGRSEVIQWTIFQVANVGPMFGQCGHFLRYAPKKIPYAIDRYKTETERLYRVMDKRLKTQPYLAGKKYSIADMATYPWVKIDWFHKIDIKKYPNVSKWRDRVAARPAVQRGVTLLDDVMKLGNPDKEAFKNLFTKQKSV